MEKLTVGFIRGGSAPCADGNFSHSAEVIWVEREAWDV